MSLASRYTLGSTLGHGSYGKASLAARLDDGQQVVVKQVRIAELSKKEKDEALKEVAVMQELDHLNIVKYIECFEEDGCLHIVMEYAQYGELSAIIQARATAKKPLTEDAIMFWFVQIVLALWHVHSKNILHRDLKSQNIFVAAGNIAKLGDFGIARVLNSDTELVRTAIGTPYYLSPEICQDKPYNRKSDVWALGCVLYELATLRRAFDGQSLPALVVNILRGKYPPVSTRYSSQLRGLVDSMLRQDPRERPSMDAILRMEYVRQHLARYAQHVCKLQEAQQAAEMRLHLGPAAMAEGYAQKAGRRQQQQLRRPQVKAGVKSAASAGPHEAPAAAASSNPRAAGDVAVTDQADGAAAVQSAPAAAAASPDAGCSSAQSGEDAGTDSMGDSFGSSTSSSSSAEPPSAGPAGGSASDDADGDAAGDTSSEQASPGWEGVRKPGRAKMLETGWLAQQQAALDAMQQALRAGAAAQQQQQQQQQQREQPSYQGPPDVHLQQQQQQQQQPGHEHPLTPPDMQALAARVQQLLQAALPAPGPWPGDPRAAFPANRAAPRAAAAAIPGKPPAKAPAKRSGGGAAAAPPAGAAGAPGQSPQVAAARQQRLKEKQQWQDKQQRQAAKEEAKRLERAAELEQQLKEKAESRQKEKAEAQQHLAQHKEQMKAVRPRLDKAQLAQMGAQFAKRLHGEEQPAQQTTDAAAAASTSRSGADGGAEVAGCNSSSSPGGVEQSSPEVSPQRQRRSIGHKRPSQVRRRSSTADEAAAEPAAAESAATAAAAAAGSTEQQAPPWRQRRKAGQAAAAQSSVFPEVEIFCPHGSDMDMQQGLGCTIKAMPGGTSSQPGMQQVLCQLHDVLTASGESTEDTSTAPDAGRTSSASGMPAGDSQPGPTVRSPELSSSADSAAAGNTGGTAAGSKQDALQLPPEQQDGAAGQLPAAGGQLLRLCWDANTTAAQKVEQLRLGLEHELGPDKLVLAYRYLHQLQQPCSADDEASSQTQAQAQALLVALLEDQIGLLHFINKLMMLEDLVFAHAGG